MSKVNNDIAITVGADVGPLVNDMKRGGRAVRGFGNDASSMSRNFKIASTAVVASVAATAAAVVALTKRSLENIDAMSKQAKSLGLGVAQFQAMSMVANEAGVEVSAFAKALANMQRNIEAAGQGLKTQVDAVERLGLSYAQLGGLAPEEQFRKIAESLNAIEDPAKRTATAMDIFGKSGRDIINMLEGYGAAVDNASKFQEAFGIAVSDLDAAQVERANDAFGRLVATTTGLGNVIAVKVAPAIEDMSNATTGLIAKLIGVDFPLTVAERKVKLYNDTLGMMPQFADAATLANRNIKQSFEDVSPAIKAATADMAAYMALGATLPSMLPEGAPGLADETADFVSSVFDVPGFVSTSPFYNRSSAFNSSLSYSGRGGQPSSFENGGSNSFGGGMYGDIDAGGGGGALGPTEDDLNRLRASLATETELLQMRYEDELTRLQEFRDAKLITEDEFNQQEARLKQDHLDAMAEMEQRAQAARIQAISGALGDLSALMQTNNKKLFAIGKAAAVAEAVVSGYQAAVDAWQKGMKIGGPGMAAAFTAASLAKTGALISGIQSQQIGGGSTGSTGGGTGAVAAPQGPLSVRLTQFNPSGLYTGATLSALLDSLSEEAGDRGYRLMVAQ